MKIGHALKYNFITYKPELLLSPDGETGRVKFLFIENDVNEVERIKPFYRHRKGVFNKDEFIQVGTVNTNRIVNSISQRIDKKKPLTKEQEDISKWVDKKIVYPDTITEVGLAACRQIGRIAFATSFDNINEKIRTATSKLGSLANKDKDGKIEQNAIEIFIISGTCGGTGSSMFLDIAALLDDALGIHQSPKKKAVLINPNYYLEQKLSDASINKAHDQYINLQVNSTAFINECEFFILNSNKSLLGKYTARSSNHKNRYDNNDIFSPFSSAFLFDIYANNQMKIPLSSLYYVIADILFYTAISQASKEFNSHFEANTTVLGNDGQREKINYSTIGLKVVQYPKEEFIEYFRKRYMYEVFASALLKKGFKSTQIEKAAAAFIHDVIEDPESSVFANLESDYRMRLNNFKNKTDNFNYSQYLNEKEKLISKSEIIDLVNNFHSSTIAEIKNELDEKRKNMPDFGFQSRFKDNPTIADQLRSRLHRHVKNVIYNHGYFGVLGFSEGNNIEPGFLSEIDKLLREKYREITRSKKDFDETRHLNLIQESKNALLDNLNRIRLSLKLKDIKDEIDAYHTAIDTYLESLFQYHVWQLKQEVLYRFSVGDIKSDIVDSFYTAELDRNITDLNRFRTGLALAVGTSPQLGKISDSLISKYDKGANDDSDTIRNRFVKFLPNRWNATKSDLFTVCVPHNLYDYTDSASADNWKDGTDLDRIFSENVLIDFNELNKIFDDNTLTSSFVATIGLDPDKINYNIGLMMTKIEEYFIGNYIINTTQPVSEFINKTIQDVYNQASEDVKDKIKNQQSSVYYPTCDSTRTKNPVPFLNIHPDNREFAIKQLEFNKEKIIAQDSMHRHQMAFISIIPGIDYHGISGNRENTQVYRNRNLAMYRPHLHAEWNDYVDGPFDAMTNMSLEGTGDSTSLPHDRILISLLIERLCGQQPGVSKLIFVETERYLKTRKGLRSVPIAFNPQNRTFVFYPDGEILEENETDKFYVKDTAHILGKLLEDIEFDKAVKILNHHPSFNETFQSFLSVVDEHKTQIAKIVDAKVIDSISEEVAQIHQKLEKSLKKISSKDIVSEYNKQVVDTFSSRIKELASEILGINLDL